MYECVLGFLQGKAKLDVKNSEGQTALLLACRSGWIPVIEMLMSSGDIALPIGLAVVMLVSL